MQGVHDACLCSGLSVPSVKFDGMDAFELESSLLFDVITEARVVSGRISKVRIRARARVHSSADVVGY